MKNFKGDLFKKDLTDTAFIKYFRGVPLDENFRSDLLDKDFKSATLDKNLIDFNGMQTQGYLMLRE